MESYWRFVRPILYALIPASLSACMVGPNFHKPPSPQVERYTESRLPSKTVATPQAEKGGKTQYFITAEEIPAEWWTLFHSAAINSLIERGLANSPNLEAAQATLRQAQENYQAQIGNLLLPAIDAETDGTRQRAGLSNGIDTPVSIFNVFNASVGVAYTLDVFGGSRRQLEALKAQVDYQQFQLIAAYLTITTNIVTTAVSIASLEGQIVATHDLIREQEYQLNILQKQFDLGAVSKIEVLTQQTLVNQTRATLPPLEKSLSQAKHALAVLVGEFPNFPIPNFDLDKLTLPSHIPVSLPSDLIRQRPDVRAAEALFHAACAQIGVATANLLPQFTLNAAYGYSSTTLSALFDPLNKAWSYGYQITQPLFHGGALFAQRRAAIAAYQASAAQYRQTVLQAFQNVADSLRAIETDARNLRANKQSEMSAKENLFITNKQYRLGGASYLNLLVAQQQYQQARIARIKAQALRYADTAALFQALGGGWWNLPTKKCNDCINPIHASKTCP